MSRRSYPCTNPFCEKRGTIHDRGNTRDRASLRARVAAIHGLACVYCAADLNDETMTLDRIIAGCAYRPQNLVPACDRCNKSRQDSPMDTDQHATVIARSMSAYVDSNGIAYVGARRATF